MQIVTKEWTPEILLAFAGRCKNPASADRILCGLLDSITDTDGTRYVRPGGLMTRDLGDSGLLHKTTTTARAPQAAPSPTPDAPSSEDLSERRRDAERVVRSAIGVKLAADEVETFLALAKSDPALCVRLIAERSPLTRPISESPRPAQPERAKGDTSDLAADVFGRDDGFVGSFDTAKYFAENDERAKKNAHRTATAAATTKSDVGDIMREVLSATPSYSESTRPPASQTAKAGTRDIAVDVFGVVAPVRAVDDFEGGDE